MYTVLYQLSTILQCFPLTHQHLQWCHWLSFLSYDYRMTKFNDRHSIILLSMMTVSVANICQCHHSHLHDHDAKGSQNCLLFSKVIHKGGKAVSLKKLNSNYQSSISHSIIFDDSYSFQNMDKKHLHVTFYQINGHSMQHDLASTSNDWNYTNKSEHFPN